MALLDEVATYLDAQSTSFTVGATGNLVKSAMLDSVTVPNTLTGLYETPGRSLVHAFSTSATGITRVFERPNLQVLCRSTSYVTARTNAQTALTILDGLNDTSLSGTRYISVAALQSPYLLARDEDQRYIVALNFAVEKAL